MKITKRCLLWILMLPGLSCNRAINNENTDETNVSDTLHVDSLTNAGSNSLNDTVIAIHVGNQGLEIDTADLENLMVYVPYAESKAGRQIEKYAIRDPSCRIPFNTKYVIYYINRANEFMF